MPTRAVYGLFYVPFKRGKKEVSKLFLRYYCYYMTTREDLSTLTTDEIEVVEKLTLRWVYQATLDFGMAACEIFLKSPDDVKDIAEDITRELLDRLPGHNVPQRIFGTVDYKKARYVILPDQTIRQALFCRFQGGKIEFDGNYSNVANLHAD